jgi:hypothetical protein
LVDKILSLNKRLTEITHKRTDERTKIEEEITNTDNQIDKVVYMLYGIHETEQKIIEQDCEFINRQLTPLSETIDRSD